MAASQSGSTSETPAQVTSQYASDPQTADVAAAISQLLGQQAGVNNGASVDVAISHPGESVPVGTEVVQVDTSSVPAGQVGNVSAAGSTPIVDIRGSGDVRGTFTGDTNRVIVTDSGNANLVVTSGSNTVKGGTGELNLAFTGTSGQSIVAGSGETNVLLAGGANTVKLGSGAGHVEGGTGNDTIYLGTGNATISGGGGNDTVVVQGSISSNRYALDADGNLLVTSATGTAKISGINILTDSSGATFFVAKNAQEAALGRLYEAAFGRSADIVGIQSWLDRLHAGQSLTSIANQFLTGQEANAPNGIATLSTNDFVTRLYANTLDRTPDDLGFQAWTSRLSPSGGLTRADVLVQFATAGESEAANADHVIQAGPSGFSLATTPLTLDLLDTGSETVTGGTAFDLVNFARAKTDVVITTTGDTVHFFSASTGNIETAEHTEFTRFSDGGVFILARTQDEATIARMYEAVLGRDADAAGLRTLWDLHDNRGFSLTDLAKSFLGSTEYQAAHPTPVSNEQFVSDLYHNLLGRDPDAAGYNAHVADLQSGTATRESLLVDFAKGQEAVDHLQGTIRVIDHT